MSESPLEAIRRQIREAEKKLKESAPDQAKAKSGISGSQTLRTGTANASQPQGAPRSPEDRSGGERESLAALQVRLQAIVESWRDALILVDSKGVWELANDHLPEWLGYTRDEFQHVNLTEVFESDDVRRLLAAFPQWLTGKDPIRRAPFNLKGKQGITVPVLLSTHAWVSGQGEAVAYIVLEDLRIRRRLETEAGELASYLASCLRGVSEQVSADDPRWTHDSSWIKLLHGSERVCAILESWAASTGLMGTNPGERKFGEMIREAIAVRKAELARWDIQVSFDGTDNGAGEAASPPAVLPAILHVLQSCIDQVRDGAGSGNLTIRTQVLGERLESSFLLDVGDCGHLSRPVGLRDGQPFDFELHAAARILEGLGGDLSVDNSSETTRAIHLGLSLRGLTAGVPPAQSDLQCIQ